VIRIKQGQVDSIAHQLLDAIAHQLLDAIAHQLLDAGAHLDMVDKEGRTAADIWLLVQNQHRRRKCRLVCDRNDLPECP